MFFTRVELEEPIPDLFKLKGKNNDRQTFHSPYKISSFDYTSDIQIEISNHSNL